MKTRCAIAVACLLAGSGFQAPAELVDGINSIVHDSVVTYQQVARYTAPLIGQLRNEYRDQPEMFRTKLNEARDDTLERLVENQIILHDFETGEYNRGGLEGAIEMQLQDNIKATYGNRIRCIKTLQAEGGSYEQYRKAFRERIIIQEMRRLRAGEVVVSPHKIEVYYVDHPEQFREPSQIKLRMIMLSKPANDDGQIRKLADEIVAKLKEGASFTELAAIYATDAKRYPGGDWGWWEAAKLRKELAEAEPALKTGDYSGVIETPEACFLMRVEDRRPEHIKPLSEVRGSIEQFLLTQESDRLQKQWVERLRKKTFVRYFPN
jgi:peptidyl-prolyl cis-trans isomerase SurA